MSKTQRYIPLTQQYQVRSLGHILVAAAAQAVSARRPSKAAKLVLAVANQVQRPQAERSGL